MWIDALWQRRAALAVDNSAGGAGPVDVSFTVPTEWDEFWTRVKSDGFDVRIAGPDGKTAASFKRTSWTYATRTAVFEADALATSAGYISNLWFYWANAAAADASAAPTIAAPVAATAWLGRASSPIVHARPEAPGATAARATIGKTASEAVRVWWDFSDRLIKSREPIQGSRLLEEIRHVVAIDALNSAEESQAAMLDKPKTRIAEGAVSTWLKGGASGSDYMLLCRVETTFDRVLEGRCRLRVRNVEV